MTLWHWGNDGSFVAWFGGEVAMFEVIEVLVGVEECCCRY
jgi:hypothetical protein